MNILKLAMAAAIACGTVSLAAAPTLAQEHQGDRRDNDRRDNDRRDGNWRDGRHDNGRHQGWRNDRRHHGWRHRRVCRTIWRHHHRERVCRTVRYRR